MYIVYDKKKLNFWLRGLSSENVIFFWTAPFKGSCGRDRDNWYRMNVGLKYPYIASSNTDHFSLILSFIL